MSPLDIVRREEDDLMSRSDQNLKAETPGTCVNTEYTAIVAKFDEGTGDSHRDKWLERLLQAVGYIFNTERTKDEGDNKTSESDLFVEKNSKGEKAFVCPDSAVSPVVALEKALHETFASDFQKMRYKAVLARRFVNGELDAAKILSMSPTESSTRASPQKKQHERSPKNLQACKSDVVSLKLGLEILSRLGRGDTYQGRNSTKSVRTAPWATTKFENVEKQLISPRDAHQARGRCHEEKH